MEAMFIPRSQRKTIHRRLDPFCSSLAINCCQFSCCIPDVPEIEFPCTDHACNWMEQLIQVSPDAKLRDLVIPGTHDSASYSLQAFKAFSAAGRTQNVSVSEQLLRGARYLDIRVAGDGDTPTDVYIFHGCLKCAKFDVILGEIKAFLEQHPQEFIFCEIVAEFGRTFTDAQRLHALKLIKDTFGDKIYTGNNYDQLTKQWTLSQVVKDRKKNLCIMTHPRIYNFEVDGVQYEEAKVESEFGFVNSQKWMRSHWHNTRKINLIKEWNLDEVKKYGSQKQKLLNNQIVLTPGIGGPMDILHLLIGGNSLRPVSFAAGLYKSEVLDVFFRDNADEPWNMIMLDYIDLTPALVCFLISLNFTPTLTILKAAATIPKEEKSKDVTEKVKRFVKRKGVLYLTDINKDLELGCSTGTLTIAYKIGKGNENSILTVDYDPETELLLSYFCRNEENATHACIKPEEHPQGGCVARGQICTKEEATSKKGATVMEFKEGKDNCCVFEIVS